MGMDVGVYRLPMAAPNDVSELEGLINDGVVDAREIAAIIAQTEGDGFSRGYSAQNFELMLGEKLGISTREVNQRIPMLMIGLTGGLMSPHYTVFTRKEVDTAGDGPKRLALGVKTTRVLKPEEYGTVEQVNLVSEAVKEAMQEAGIDNPSDVHCVEVKCPAMTGARVQDAQQRGKNLITANPGEASTRSKGASALGVAVALGEINRDDVTNEGICRHWGLYSNVASTSAGTEQVACRIVLMGNSRTSKSRYVIGSSVMTDALDIPNALRAFTEAGVSVNGGIIPPAEAEKIAAVFINAGANASGSIRGRRHTMLSDYLVGYSGIFAKAVINAIVGALIGDTMILASAGFEHQGPAGANLVAVIADTGEV